MKEICNDLKAEHEELEAVLTDLAEKDWQTLTPCDDWTIQDQIVHLAFFDDSAFLSASDPDGFNAHFKELTTGAASLEDLIGKKVPTTSAAALMESWKACRAKMLSEFNKLAPKDRLPWYGPPMSALSFATARLMETWAHGQDIYDALGVKRVYADRLRHIAHLGVTTFGWTYINRGVEIPKASVRVELTAPSGEIWTWGPEDAKDSVTGPAEGFCLVVVQRRHVDDTGLTVTGETARDWMIKAQCYAGPATDGPAPGSI